MDLSEIYMDQSYIKFSLTWAVGNIMTDTRPPHKSYKTTTWKPMCFFHSFVSWLRQKEIEMWCGIWLSLSMTALLRKKLFVDLRSMGWFFCHYVKSLDPAVPLFWDICPKYLEQKWLLRVFFIFFRKTLFSWVEVWKSLLQIFQPYLIFCL